MTCARARERVATQGAEHMHTGTHADVPAVHAHLMGALVARRELVSAAGSGPGLADMFARIMVAVDEDIISLDIPRCVCVRAVSLCRAARICVCVCVCWHALVTAAIPRGCPRFRLLPAPSSHTLHGCTHRSAEGTKLSMHIKDAMRESCIADVAAAWCSITQVCVSCMLTNGGTQPAAVPMRRSQRRTLAHILTRVYTAPAAACATHTHPGLQGLAPRAGCVCAGQLRTLRALDGHRAGGQRHVRGFVCLGKCVGGGGGCMKPLQQGLRRGRHQGRVS